MPRPALKQSVRASSLWHVVGFWPMFRPFMVAGVGVIGTSAFGIWLGRQGVTDAQLIIVVVVCVAIVVVATVMSRRYARGRFAGPSWTDMEARFKELQERSRDNTAVNRAMRADYLPKTGGSVRWQVYGSTGTYVDEGKRLCALAGRKLKASGIANSSIQVASESDDLSRWLWFLVDIGAIRKAAGSVMYPNMGPPAYLASELLDACVGGCVECLRREMATPS